MVLHKANNRPNKFGGTTYRTLCGRTNAACTDGANVADSDAEVTCKFCLRAALIKADQIIKDEQL